MFILKLSKRMNEERDFHLKQTEVMLNKATVDLDRYKKDHDLRKTTI